MTFSRSKVASLEITPCTAACVSVPAVLVVCPPAGVCSRCSNNWSGVLDVTGVNKAAREQSLNTCRSIFLEKSLFFSFLCISHLSSFSVLLHL